MGDPDSRGAQWREVVARSLQCIPCVHLPLHSGEKCIDAQSSAYGNAHWCTVLVHRLVHIGAQSAAYGNAFLFLSAAAAAAASGGSGTQWMH